MLGFVDNSSNNAEEIDSEEDSEKSTTTTKKPATTKVQEGRHEKKKATKKKSIIPSDRTQKHGKKVKFVEQNLKTKLLKSRFMQHISIDYLFYYIKFI